MAAIDGDDDDHTSITFAGHTVAVEEDAIWGGGPSDGDGTGWKVWNSAKLLLRVLEARHSVVTAARWRDGGDVGAAADDGLPARGPSAAAVASALSETLASFIGDASGGAAPPQPLRRPDEDPDPVSAEAPVILDLSAGTGIVGLACAAAGATVVLTDTPAQVDAIAANVASNAAAVGHAGVVVTALFWGDDVKDTLAAAAMDARGKRAAAAATTAGTTGGSGAGDSPRTSAVRRPLYDAVLVADVLFCAVRDGLTDVLLETLVALIEGGISPVVLFAWETRRREEEDAFVRRMRTHAQLRVGDCDVSGVDVADLVAAGKFGVATADVDAEEGSAGTEGASRASDFHVVVITAAAMAADGSTGS